MLNSALAASARKDYKSAAIHVKSLGTLSREQDALESMHSQGIRIDHTPKTISTVDSNGLPCDINKAKEYLKDKTENEVLSAVGIQVLTDENGKKVLSEYKSPRRGVSYGDLGIDEKKLLKDVVEIKGDCDLSESFVTDLGKVEKIGGNLVIGGRTSVRDLSSVQEVKGRAIVYADTKDEARKKLKDAKMNTKSISGSIIGTKKYYNREDWSYGYRWYW